jgi:regulator of replication initiation timing
MIHFLKRRCVVVFAAVRVQKINGLRGMQSIENHGRRLDPASAARVDPAKTSDNLAWSCSDDPLAVVDAFKRRKSETGAKEYRGSPLGLHVLCVVSPEWCSAAGDLHDPGNDRNKRLFDAARAWGDKTFGPGAVVAARMDMDEAGGGVVDLVIVPVAEVKQRGKVKNQISVNKAYEAAFGGGRVFSKLQDSWAGFAKAHLDSAIERGKPKAETGRDHVHADIYRPIVQEAERQADEIKRQAVEQWSDVSDWPWRDRAKVVEIAREVGAKEGAAVVRRKALAVLSAVKAKAEKEKIEAIERKDKEWSVQVSAVKSEVESVRVNLGTLSEERDALALEVDVLRSENERLKTEVSGLKRTVSRAVELLAKIAKSAPEPVKKLIARFFEPDGGRKDSSPSSPPAPASPAGGTPAP